jgi:hypothetical protein
VINAASLLLADVSSDVTPASDTAHGITSKAGRREKLRRARAHAVSNLRRTKAVPWHLYFARSFEILRATFRLPFLDDLFPKCCLALNSTNSNVSR